MRWLRRQAQRFGRARALSVLLLLALVGVRVADPGPMEELRVRTFDSFQLLSPREVTQRPVVIVDIDDRSLNSLGQWPWARTRVADLVTRLGRLGAVVIGFDIIFAEADRLSPDVAASEFQGLDDATRERLRSAPNNDQVLAQAFRQTRVVLGESGVPTPGQNQTVPQPTHGVGMLGTDATPFLFEFPGLLRNIPLLEGAAAGLGLISIKPERDGIIRRVAMVMRAAGNPLPSLSTEILRVASNSEALLIKADDLGVSSVKLRGFEIPTDRNGQIWVHFSHHDPARFVSAVDVLEGRVPADRVAGHVVLIGTSAVGLLDTKTTPVDPVVPGVEVHAQILENVLGHSTLSQPNFATAAEIVVALVVGGVIVWLVPVFGPLVIMLFGAVIAVVIAGASWYLFTAQRLLIDPTFPLVSSFFIYIVLVFTNYISEQAQRRRIRSAFGQYLSPALVERLAKSPEDLVLGGEVRSLTVMFSDVRGFTTLSETYKNDPQGLISLMNRLLTPLTNAIVNRQGTIDKYMGDAIMAFWNAPLDDPAHEANACNAALDMMEEMRELNVARRAEAEQGGAPFIPINIGIGLNTGNCVVGNMGSDLRFDYSALGDSVNLASRLEGQSKTYGVPIVLGSNTAQAVKDKFAVIEIDFIRVKGKTEPEIVYAVFGREDLLHSPQFQALRDLNIALLAHYRSRDWDGALGSIEKIRATDGEGRLAECCTIYEKRIAAFREQPPGADWDGVFTLTTK
ncbi:MAG: adenylate/guanylate cyclase domain-containing protein [Xanthobacteraceae bacterium]|nr:adenylate/guanylate cyclase domain-containing protein [Xanthobacteraceae bacterium]